jgi:RND family efflux transporter MFP subunit
MKPWMKYTLALLALMVLAALFYLKVFVPKHTFDTVHPTKGDLTVRVFGIGEVDTRDIYPLGAQTGGKILTLPVDEGTWVKKGDVIATIDPVDLPQLLDEAKITEKKARFAVRAAQKQLQSLEAQKRLSKITYERYGKLKTQGFAAQAEYDKAKADLQSIDAQIDATLAQIDSAKIEIDRARKSIEALQEKLERLQVVSPVDGLVVSRDAAPAQTVLPSQAIVHIVDPKTVWVKAWIDERISGGVQTGQPATITLRSQSGKTMAGRVVRIGTQSDPVTQEREVDVAFMKLPVPFYLHERAEVAVETGSMTDTKMIPARLLTFRNDKAGVWTLKQNRAHWQPVKVAGRTDEKAAIASGLKASDTLLIPDATKKALSEGMKIFQ